VNELWLKPALIGVEQAPSFDLDGEIGDLLGNVAADADPALAFGRCAGVLAACGLAAVRLPETPVELPAPAAPDANVLPATHSWTAALAAVFAAAPLQQNYDTRLRHEACLRLAAAGRVLPALLLPRALEAGQRNQALRPALLPVLGHRGRWLAAQNPDWKFAIGAGDAAEGDHDTRLWQEGNHLERLAWFARLRARDAAAARQRLQAGLGEMAAKERLDFVAGLQTGLQPDDAPLLEPLLKDRSRDVRHAAARLLACLPQSAHAQRLREWTAPLLTQKRGLLGKSWQIDAPASADPAWASAAIEAARPQHEALGERAWWLYQLARQLPLDWWNEHTGMSAKELVAWSDKTDWAAALQRGWCERVGADQPDWIEALLTLRTREARAEADRLLALLPVAQREGHWPDRIDALWKDGTVSQVMAACGLGETLSLTYSKTLLASLLACFEDDRLRHDYGLRGCLLELAAMLHPDAIGGVRSVARRADETPAMAECALAFERILQVRAVLRAAP
jgi:hypothetical protein